MRERALPVEVLMVVSHSLDRLPFVFSAGKCRDPGPRLFSLHVSHVGSHLEHTRPCKSVLDSLRSSICCCLGAKSRWRHPSMPSSPSLGNLLTLSGPYEPTKSGAACAHMPHKQYVVCVVEHGPLSCCNRVHKE